MASVSVFEIFDILLVFAAEAPEEPSSPNAGFIQLMIQAEISSINLFTSYCFLKQKCGCECKVEFASDHTQSVRKLNIERKREFIYKLMCIN